AVHAAPPAAIYARSLHDALPIFAEGQHAVVLGSVSHFAPKRMVAVLLASPGIASGRLQMAPGIGADPDVTISRGNGQGVDAPDGFRVAQAFAPLVEIDGFVVEDPPGITRRVVTDVM